MRFARIVALAVVMGALGCSSSNSSSSTSLNEEAKKARDATMPDTEQRANEMRKKFEGGFPQFPNKP
jgi:hypothetical protein